MSVDTLEKADVQKNIRMTETLASRLDAAKDLYGSYSNALEAALDALDTKHVMTNKDLIRLVTQRLGG